MLAIWPLVPLAFLNPAWTSGSSQFTYCWTLAWRILSITLLVVRWVQLCGSLNIYWHCLSLGLEWKRTFSSPVATAEFSKFAGILSAALSQHHLLGFVKIKCGSRKQPLWSTVSLCPHPCAHALQYSFPLSIFFLQFLQFYLLDNLGLGKLQALEWVTNAFRLPRGGWRARFWW